MVNPLQALHLWCVNEESLEHRQMNVAMNRIPDNIDKIQEALRFSFVKRVRNNGS